MATGTLSSFPARRVVASVAGALLAVCVIGVVACSGGHRVALAQYWLGGGGGVDVDVTTDVVPAGMATDVAPADVTPLDKDDPYWVAVQEIDTYSNEVTQSISAFRSAPCEAMGAMLRQVEAGHDGFVSRLHASMATLPLHDQNALRRLRAKTIEPLMANEFLSFYQRSTECEDSVETPSAGSPSWLAISRAHSLVHRQEAAADQLQLKIEAAGCEVGEVAGLAAQLHKSKFDFDEQLAQLGQSIDSGSAGWASVKQLESMTAKPAFAQAEAALVSKQRACEHAVVQQRLRAVATRVHAVVRLATAAVRAPCAEFEGLEAGVVAAAKAIRHDAALFAGLTQEQLATEAAFVHRRLGAELARLQTRKGACARAAAAALAGAAFEHAKRLVEEEKGLTARFVAALQTVPDCRYVEPLVRWFANQLEPVYSELDTTLGQLPKAHAHAIGTLMQADADPLAVQAQRLIRARTYACQAAAAQPPVVAGTGVGAFGRVNFGDVSAGGVRAPVVSEVWPQAMPAAAGVGTQVNIIEEYVQPSGMQGEPMQV